MELGHPLSKGLIWKLHTRYTINSHIPVLNVQWETDMHAFWSECAAPWEHSGIKWRRKKYAEPHRRTSGCFICLGWPEWDLLLYAKFAQSEARCTESLQDERECLLTGRWIGKWGKWEAAHSNKGNSYLQFLVIMSCLHSQGLLMAWFHIQC